MNVNIPFIYVQYFTQVNTSLQAYWFQLTSLKYNFFTELILSYSKRYFIS